jgi:hypothetical protein
MVDLLLRHGARYGGLATNDTPPMHRIATLPEVCGDWDLGPHLAAGADFLARDGSGDNVIYALATPDGLHISERERFLKQALAAGADINDVTNDGHVPLLRAFGDAKLYDMLVRHGARFDLTCSNDATFGRALHNAIRADHVVPLRTAHEQGVLVKSIDDFKKVELRSLMRAAVYCGATACMEFLMEEIGLRPEPEFPSALPEQQGDSYTQIMAALEWALERGVDYECEVEIPGSCRRMSMRAYLENISGPLPSHERWSPTLEPRLKAKIHAALARDRLHGGQPVPKAGRAERVRI